MATNKKKKTSGKKAKHEAIDTVIAHIFAMFAAPKRMQKEANLCRGALRKVKKPAHRQFLSNMIEDILAASEDKKVLARLEKNFVKWMNKEGFHS